MNIHENKELIGKILFIISIGFLIYMLITPINHFFTHVDEYFTLSAIKFPFMDMITILANDCHPPLHYIMAKLWVNLFSVLGIGSELFVLKTLSILSYALCLVVSFFKIRKEHGWLAAGLFSLSLMLMTEFFAWFLTGRMYGWAILFLALTFVYYMDVIQNFDKKSFALFTVFSVASIATHYFALLSVACMYLFVFIYMIRYDKLDKIKYFILSAVAAVLLYSPWIPYLYYQLFGVKNAFSISALTSDTVISAFSFFAYSNLIPGIVFCVILIVLMALFIIDSKDWDDLTRFYILTGLGVYIGTIIIAVGISIVYKPILRIRYLLPAAAVMWLALSICLTKIKDKKRFYISTALIVFLLLSGAVNVLDTNKTFYDDGIVQQEIFDQLSQDNAVVIARPSVFSLIFANQTDMYAHHIDDWRGVSTDKVHQYFDFKDIEREDIPTFIKNNTDKEIYLIDWKEPDYDGITTMSVFNYYTLDFSKVLNFNSTVAIGNNGTSKVSIPNGFKVTKSSENSVTVTDGKNNYTIAEVNDTMDSVFKDYYQKHKNHKVTEKSFDAGNVTVKALVLEVDGKYIHTNYFYEKNGKLYQIYPQGDDSKNLLKGFVSSTS
ncbi:MAG: hypothetical protein IJL02_05825 [Methanobrevibacter sp.]|uniref:glycosyltransferase family 39 protein n=1 Tax=Methanobrevibacter sp. TaxID=66852 RepID=UPI0025CEF5AD|nr:hypothetical protein [Methanobrevibacter sp.]MBQ6099365.1 hypothetical protein [Methanobrevibacter sp.]